MAWGLTIHKSQGMTLKNVTIDIGNIDRQGLTFTAISRVIHSLQYQELHLFQAYVFLHLSLFPDTLECKEIDMLNVENKRKAYLLQSL